MLRVRWCHWDGVLGEALPALKASPGAALVKFVDAGRIKEQQYVLAV